MIRVFAALLAVLLFTLAPARAAEEVKITADQFIVDDAKSTATFTGNVVVERSNLKVWAPSVVVDYGAEGPSSIRSFVATGGVRIKTSTQDARGDRAVYDPDAGTLKLSGNVMVTNATGTVGGPDLLINLVTNTSTFTGGGSRGRVSGVFTSQ